MAAQKYFYKLSELMRPLSPGIDWAVIKGVGVTIVYYEMVGSAPMSIKPHSHANEQLTFMLEGRMKLTTGEESKVLGPGELAYMPPGMMHKGELLGENLKMIDVFYPRRDDHLEKYLGEAIVSPSSTAFPPTLTEPLPLFVNFMDYNIELREGLAVAPFNCHTLTAALLQIGAQPGAKEHTHPQEEVNAYLAGEMVATVGGQSQVVGPGWIVMIPPDVPHTFLMTKPALQVNFSTPPRGPGYADFLRGISESK